MGRQVTSKEEFPYMARVVTTYKSDDGIDRHESDSECGGVVVTSRFVLTAAHCVKRLKELSVEEEEDEEDEEDGWSTTVLIERQNATVYLGALRQDWDDSKQSLDVIEFIIEGYESDYFDENYRDNENGGERESNWDLALLRTNDQIRIDNFEIARAVLGNHRSMSELGWECDVTGFGRSTVDEITNGNSSPVLKSAKNNIIRCTNLNQLMDTMPPISREVCTEGEFTPQIIWPIDDDTGNYDETKEMTEQMIAPSPMSGDSGGPLSCHPQSRPYNHHQHKSVYALMRSVHWGVGGGHGLSPAYHTRIAFHDSWIAEKVGPNDVLLDGRDAAMGQFPYQVAVYGANRQFKCSGTIVSDEWVLSADSCFERNGAVLAGEVDLDVAGNFYRQRRDCVEIVAHRDVALCRMNATFDFGKFVQKVDLAPKGSQQLGQCQFSSWDFFTGNVYFQENRFHNYLRWKKAFIRDLGAGGPLNVDVDPSFGVDPWNMDMNLEKTSPGAGLVCFGRQGGNRDKKGYLVGVNAAQLGHQRRFVDVRY